MISEKIQNLLKELQVECDKNDVSAVCTVQKAGYVTTMTVGRIPDIGLILYAQEQELDKSLPVPARILRSVACEAAEKASAHHFVLNDLNDIPDVLECIMKGEFE